MRKITLLPLALSLCAAAALAEDPQLPPAMQLAAEAKALCEAQKTQTVADCVRETLGDAGIESVQQALADQQRAASDVYYTDVAEQLLKREEPRAMLLAARLLRSTIDYRLGGPRQDEAAKALRARIAELVRAAALRAEGDEMVQWTLAGDAFRRELPDVAAAAIERLRQRDPDNLAVFFLGDSHGPWSSERVQLAAVTRRFELPFYDLMRSDLELLASFKMPASLLDAPNIQNLESIDGHQIMVFGLQMAESVPALLGLTRACRPGGEGWLPELRPSCERIASVLTHESNSLIGWSVGIALLEGLAETQEDRAAAEAARRTYRYQVEEGTLSQRTDEGQIAWLRAMREPGADEIAMLRQQLAARGLPETPPADWQPMTYEEQQAQWAADRAKRSE